MLSLRPANTEEILRRCVAKSGDLILFAVGKPAAVNRTLDRLRLFVAQNLNLIDHVGAESLY